MNNVFEWKNICSIENAAILEMLLDRKAVPFDEIVYIFGIDTKPDNDSYLINLINPWHSTATLIGRIFSLKISMFIFLQDYFFFQLCMTLHHDLVLLKQYYIPNLGEHSRSVVCTDKILSLMIRKKILPAEICRLPRLKNEQLCIEVIPDYYEDHLDYNTATEHEIVFHCKNHSSAEPLTFTYSEAIKYITQNGHPESLIQAQVKEGKLALYLQVPEKSIINDSQVRRLSSQSLDYFRNLNCGNSSYTTRYKGLERLMHNDVEKLFDGESIYIKDNGRNAIRNYLDVQSTDLESKFHLKRQIKSCVQLEYDGTKKESNEFQLKDSLYLKEDVVALILFEPQAIIEGHGLPASIDTQMGITVIAHSQIENNTKDESPNPNYRSVSHPAFTSYAKSYARNSTLGGYLKMMIGQRYVFADKTAYLSKANDDNTDNTHDHIKQVALVKGVTKQGNSKFDIYYKPVLNDGASLGSAMNLSQRTAETYFNPKKQTTRE